ncbi:hypothetical protein BBD39_05535 [Arsenophonus endosymbiont of Bemisia tabaci Asia II 3]|nr:hypothetical protein BBD39_05535 [Arsenophonus endosymbiont of Bemisia tabaci Asia II 3]
MADKNSSYNMDKVPAAEHHEPIQSEVLAAEASQAATAEHEMSLWQAIKTYPKAIGWSVLVSSTLIMEGYDLALLGNLYASPVFNEKFGHWNQEAEKYQVSAAWQSGLSNGARAGEIIGLIIAGWITDRYGAKITTVGFLVMMIGTIFVLFFAPNIQVLVAGEVLCGTESHAPSEEIFQLTVANRRNPMGCFPKRSSTIRLGGCASRASPLPHNFHQHVLGHWSIFRRSRYSRLCRLPGLSGISHSFWCSVALARPDLVWSRFRTRVSLRLSLLQEPSLTSQISLVAGSQEPSL